LVPLPTLYKHKPAWDKTLNENSPPSVHVQPKAACVHHTINREAMRTMRQQFADFLTYTKAMCSLRGWNDALDEKGDQVRSCHTDAEEYRPFFGEREANLWRPGGAYDKVKVPVVPDDLGIATIRHREDCRKFLTLARSTKPEDRYHAFLWIVSNGARSRGYSSTFTDVNVNVEPAAHRARLTRALLAVHTSKLLVATPVAGTPTHDRYNTLFA
jgi:hypothetical protein